MTTSNRTEESTSLDKGGFGGVKCLGSRKQIGVKRGSRAIKKSEKTGLQCKAILFPGKIKMKIPASTAAVSTSAASTRVLFTLEVPSVVVDDDGALKILFRSASGKAVLLIRS